MSHDARSQFVLYAFEAGDGMAVDVAPDDVAPDAIDADGYAALHRAASHGDVAQIVLLVNQGARVDQRTEHDGVCGGATALHCAVVGGHLAAVDRLLRSGASVDACDGAGFTPLTLAAAIGRYDLVKRLLAAGARPCAEVGDSAPIAVARRAGHGSIAALLRQVCGARSR